MDHYQPDAMRQMPSASPALVAPFPAACFYPGGADPLRLEKAMITPPLDVPALSIRQPWATFILNDWKPCENRTWDTDYRGTFLVHASQKWDPPPPDIAAELAESGITPAGSSRGYLGVVDLVSIHPAVDCKGPCGVWGETGPETFHWVLANPRPFPQPVPGPGRLGLYRKGIPPEAVAVARVVLL
jgi:hypothetical protein